MCAAFFESAAHMPPKRRLGIVARLEKLVAQILDRLSERLGAPRSGLSLSRSRAKATLANT